MEEWGHIPLNQVTERNRNPLEREFVFLKNVGCNGRVTSISLSTIENILIHKEIISQQLVKNKNNGGFLIDDFASLNLINLSHNGIELTEVARFDRIISTKNDN